MARPGQTADFLIGLTCGAVAGFAIMLSPVLWLGMQETAEVYGRVAPWLHRAWELVSVNLQGSVLPFAVVLLAYAVQLRKLQQLFAAPEPDLHAVVRHEQLLDLCANLFFGIGVIWTAIGMREALLYGLGDPGVAASEGAFAILQRLVDGGILLALSTTIVGGIGGYLMRAIKSIALGRAMSGLYMRASQQPVQEHLATLQRIEHLLQETPADGRAQQ